MTDFPSRDEQLDVADNPAIVTTRVVTISVDFTGGLEALEGAYQLPEVAHRLVSFSPVQKTLSEGLLVDGDGLASVFLTELSPGLSPLVVFDSMGSQVPAGVVTVTQAAAYQAPFDGVLVSLAVNRAHVDYDPGLHELLALEFPKARDLVSTGLGEDKQTLDFEGVDLGGVYAAAPGSQLEAVRTVYEVVVRRLHNR